MYSFIEISLTNNNHIYVNTIRLLIVTYYFCIFEHWTTLYVFRYNINLEQNKNSSRWKIQFAILSPFTLWSARWVWCRSYRLTSVHQNQKIPIDLTLKNNLIHHSIGLVDIFAFINSNNPLKLWSLCIPPSSNPPSSLIDNIFQLVGNSSILGGNNNGHRPAWDKSNNQNHRGNIIPIHSSISNDGLSILNSSVPTR